MVEAAATESRIRQRLIELGWTPPDQSADSAARLGRLRDEWRDIANREQAQRRAIAATARIAIAHLQAVLNEPRSFYEQQRADTAARDWLASIGSEPGSLAPFNDIKG